MSVRRYCVIACDGCKAESTRYVESPGVEHGATHAAVASGWLWLGRRIFCLSCRVKIPALYEQSEGEAKG